MKNGWNTSETSFDSSVLSNPLSFLRNGYFYWNNADLSYRGGSGFYWSLRSANTTNSDYLNFNSTALNPQNSGSRGSGCAVRCVDKSFTTLINTSYSMKNTTQAPEASDKDSGVLSNPLSFLRSSLYYWYGDNIANINGHGNYGNSWSLRSDSTSNSNRLNFNPNYLDPQNSNYRGYGYVVRCVSISSKSFTILINTSYSMKDNNQTSEDNRDSGVLSNPLSFIRSGYFNWDIATLRYHGNVGYYWLLRSGNAISSYGLGLSNMSLSPQGIGYRGDGFAVRCVQILHHSH